MVDDSFSGGLELKIMNKQDDVANVGKLLESCCCRSCFEVLSYTKTRNFPV